MNNKIKEILSFKEDADYKRLSIEDILLLKDYIINLQESEAYYYGQYKDYKSRNEKAIEYIKLWHYRNDFRVNSFTKGVKEELLEIFQGSVKE